MEVHLEARDDYDLKKWMCVVTLAPHIAPQQLLKEELQSAFTSLHYSYVQPKFLTWVQAPLQTVIV